MGIDAAQLFAGVVGVVFLVAGIDVGLAFLMRAEQESTDT